MSARSDTPASRTLIIREMPSNPNRIIEIFLREYDFEKAAEDEKLMREFAEEDLTPPTP
jgi:hypothetical protein